MLYAVAGPETGRRVMQRLERALEGRAVLVVDRRRAERRGEHRRQTAAGPPAGVPERRRVSWPGGRRVADRRVLAMPVAGPALPWSLRRHASRLQFMSPLALPADYLEATQTARTALAAQGGDPAAMRELFDAHFTLVHAFARTSLRDAEAAERATQEIFAAMIDGIDRYEPSRSPFRVWLMRIAIDEVDAGAAAGAKAPATRRVAVPADAGFSALQWVTDDELRLLVERLPHAQRQVVLLRHLCGFAPAVTAELLGIGPARADELYAGALDSLRGMLAGLGRAQDTMQREHMRRLARPSRVLRRRQLALRG
jgi:RNA polymerase sigma factor (sigma-70 family)